MNRLVKKERSQRLKKPELKEPKSQEEPKPEEKERSEESEWLENLVAIVVVTLIVVVTIGLFQGWFFHHAPPPTVNKTYPIGIDDDPMLGNQNAKVTMIEFSDYRCPACRDFEEQTWPLIKQAYVDTGKLRFVYRDYPLESLHPGATNVAATVNCAGEQGRFWEFHDAFYHEQSNISEALVDRLVKQYGMNKSVLDACRKSGRQHEEIARDVQDAVRNGEVSGAPTFFIDGHRIVGNQPFSTFQRVIEQELARTTS